MKKILVICGCFLALCLLSSCSFIVGDKDDPHPQNNDPQEQIQEELQDQTQKDPQDHEKTSELFCNYQDILDAISLLHSQGDSFNDSQYSNLDKRESEIYNSLSHFICGGSGYCIKDINNDGVDELILLTEWWNLKGMFTMKDGLPVLLEKCDDGGIGKDGKIRVEYTEESGEYRKTIYRLKSLEDGALVTSAELEEIDFIDGDKTDEYYQIINGEGVYCIYTYNQFRGIEDITKNSSNKFMLMRDIDVSVTYSIHISDFYGEFDGNGKTLRYVREVVFSLDSYGGNYALFKII